MSEQQRQPTAESHQSVKIEVKATQTFKRSLTRKNAQTNRSNYPTIQSGRTTSTNYNNGQKSITNRNYRRIQPSD